MADRTSSQLVEGKDYERVEDEFRLLARPPCGQCHLRGHGSAA